MNPVVETLSTRLFNLDPLGTCCKENDCYDEYYGIAGYLYAVFPSKVEDENLTDEELTKLAKNVYEEESVENE